jgi:hypothetical protein
VHSGLQAPAVQWRLVTPLDEQARPQLPQWSGWLVISTQLPAQQVLLLVPHGLLHAPQFDESVNRSTHSELQQERPIGQACVLGSQPTVQVPEGLHSLPRGH